MYWFFRYCDELAPGVWFWTTCRSAFGPVSFFVMYCDELAPGVWLWPTCRSAFGPVSFLLGTVTSWPVAFGFG